MKATVPRGVFPNISEADWSRQVTKIARDCGYGPTIYHTHYAIGSERGFPDLVLIRPARGSRGGRVVFAELKSLTGKVSDKQVVWLEALRGAGAEAYVWRPGEEQAICDLLVADAPPCPLPPLQLEESDG